MTGSEARAGRKNLSSPAMHIYPVNQLQWGRDQLIAEIGGVCLRIAL